MAERNTIVSTSSAGFDPPPPPPPQANTRTFETGATRDTDKGKYDYEGFLSPLVIERFGQYMNFHRVQADGTLRDSDNWQKGIPLTVYMKSLLRHTIDLWRAHRGYGITPGGPRDPKNIEDILCAVIFNAAGYLHETIKNGPKEKK